jgi:hypothetical protein
MNQKKYLPQETIINSINEIPEAMYLVQASPNVWGLAHYNDYGQGFACFLSEVDSKAYRDIQTNRQLKVVKVPTLEILFLARGARIKYIHLLSNDINNPLAHYEVDRYTC